MCFSSKSKIPTFFWVPILVALHRCLTLFSQLKSQSVQYIKKISSFSLNKGILTSLSKTLQNYGFNSVSEMDFSSSETHVDK